MKKKTKNLIEIKAVEYYSDAEVKCSCGANFKVGSTTKTISVEVCSSCHPYYTGTQKLIDTSGRVDKFKDRLAKQEEMLKETKSKNTKKPSPKKTKNMKNSQRTNIEDLKRKENK